MAKSSIYPKEFRNKMARECYEQLLERLFLTNAKSNL